MGNGFPFLMVTFEIRDVSDEVARNFEREFFMRQNVLETHLASMSFGDLFSGDIHVTIFEYMPPASQALLPAWRGCRGQMKFAALRVRQGRAAILHELVHVYEPNQVRFLAEGFAVYLEETIGNIDVYPTFGAAIEARLKSTHSSALASVKLDVFERVSVGRGLSLGNSIELQTAIPVTAERAAYSYLVSGSFVKFLIAVHGVDKFKALYELTPLTPGVSMPVVHDRYERVFSKPLSELQAEWLRWLENFPRAMSPLESGTCPLSASSET
jgi:hypothetical protein